MNTIPKSTKTAKMGRPALQGAQRQSFTLTEDLVRSINEEADDRFNGNVSQLLRHILNEYYARRRKRNK